MRNRLWLGYEGQRYCAKHRVPLRAVAHGIRRLIMVCPKCEDSKPSTAKKAE